MNESAIELLRRIAVAVERIADAAERIADAAERIAAQYPAV